MNTTLQGLTAVVTGGSKGYGRGIAAVLAERGVRVLITGRDEPALRAAAEELGCGQIRADAASAADWARVFERVDSDFGRLDILVNNAGMTRQVVPLAEQDEDVIAEILAVNLLGAALGCRRAAQVMQAQGSGSIINVSSVCQRHAWPGWAAYSAAKAGLCQLGRCLHAELRPYGVRVTTLVPSWGATDFGAAANLPAQRPEVLAQTAQPRELGEIVAGICELPAHLVIPELTVMPLVQEIAAF